MTAAAVVAGAAAGAAAGLVAAALVRRRYPAGAGPCGFEGRAPGSLPVATAAPVAAALLGGLAGIAGGGGAVEAAARGMMLALLVTLSLMDLERGLLPDVLTLPGCALAVALAPWLAGGYREAVLGGGTAFAIALVLYLVPWGSLGAGDVKLCALLGCALGLPRVLDALLAGVTLGALGAVAYMAWPARDGGGVGVLRRMWRRRRDAIPYGPFLAAGGAIFLAAGGLWR